MEGKKDPALNAELPTSFNLVKGHLTLFHLSFLSCLPFETFWPPQYIYSSVKWMFRRYRKLQPCPKTKANSLQKHSHIHSYNVTEKCGNTERTEWKKRNILTVGDTLVLDFKVLVRPRTGIGKNIRTGHDCTLGTVVTSVKRI